MNFIVFFDTVSAAGAENEEKLFQMGNEYRKEKNLPVYKRNSQLDSAAKLQADYCAQNDELTHSQKDPLMTSPSQRMEKSGYKMTSSAENAAQMNGSNPDDPFIGWKNSPSHNDNLLGDYKEAGYASASTNDNKMYWIGVYGTSDGESILPKDALDNKKSNSSDQKTGNEKEEEDSDISKNSSGKENMNETNQNDDSEKKQLPKGKEDKTLDDKQNQKFIPEKGSEGQDSEGKNIEQNTKNQVVLKAMDQNEETGTKKSKTENKKINGKDVKEAYKKPQQRKVYINTSYDTTKKPVYICPKCGVHLKLPD